MTVKQKVERLITLHNMYPHDYAVTHDHNVMYLNKLSLVAT